MYVCERTKILGDVNNVQLQVMEYLDNCQEPKYTGVPDKTITLIKSWHITVTYQQYILSGGLLLKTKIYRCKSKTVGIIVENKNIQVEM